MGEEADAKMNGSPPAAHQMDKTEKWLIHFSRSAEFCIESFGVL